MTDLTQIPGIGTRWQGILLTSAIPISNLSRGRILKKFTQNIACFTGREISRVNVCCIAIAWPCITQTTTANYRPINKTGGIGRIRYEKSSHRRYHSNRRFIRLHPVLHAVPPGWQTNGNYVRTYAGELQLLELGCRKVVYTSI